MQYYNIHSHVFTMKNAPERFLNLYLPDFAASWIDKLTNTQAGANTLAFLLSKLPSNAAKRYASFLRIGKSAEQIDVFRTLQDQYRPDTEFKFVGLTMYMEDSGALSSQSGYEGQLESVLEIKKQYPDQFLVFLGVDPRWKGSATELRKTVEEKFNYRLSVNAARSVFPYVGLKIYPSMGFYAFDKRLTETFEWAADNGVPVLSHCNYLGGLYNNDMEYLQNTINTTLDPYNGKIYSAPKYQSKFRLGKWLLGTNKAENNKVTCSYFLEPAGFSTMVDYFNSHRVPFQKYADSWFDAYRKSLDKLTGNQRLPLKICLAHYGGDDQILLENKKITEDNPIGITDKNWCGQVKDLMTQYEGIYTDISYALSNKAVHEWILNDLQDKKYGDRIMFGTDFFLTERELPEKDDYLRFRQTAQDQPMPGSPGKTAWDIIASRNPDQFLRSKYYNGSVI